MGVITIPGEDTEENRPTEFKKPNCSRISFQGQQNLGVSPQSEPENDLWSQH